MSAHALTLHVKYILVINLFSQVRKYKFFSPEQIWHGHESVSGLCVELTDAHEEFLLVIWQPKAGFTIIGKG